MHLQTLSCLQVLTEGAALIGDRVEPWEWGSESQSEQSWARDAMSPARPALSRAFVSLFLLKQQDKHS